MTEPRQRRSRVLIAGGGIAGIEAALALREFAGDAASVAVVDPGRRFIVPGTATAQAFGVGGGVDLRLADVVDRAGAELIAGRLESVDARRRAAVLAGGRVMAYDALIVAVGATPVPAVRGALTFAGAPDALAMRALVDEVARRTLRGASSDVAVIVPPGCGWPLAAYELALMMREHLSLGPYGDRAEVVVVTSEETALGIFGEAAGAAVARMLRRAGVGLRAGAVVRAWEAGRLELGDGSWMWADRAVALPVYRGPAIAGLPADDLGFVRTGPGGAVEGAAGVWAVGDGTDFPIKQGGVACQQADAAATAIARSLGASVPPPPPAVTLTGWMWDGHRGRALPSGMPDPDAGVGAPEPIWPVAKVGGRFLAPFLHALVAAGSLSAGPVGVPA